MQLHTVELFHVRVPLLEPFRTAHGVTVHKESLLVCAHTDEGVGWGECAAEIAPSYTSEFLESAWLVLRDHLVPRLQASPWSSYGELDQRMAAVQGHPMAKAAIDTAVLDAHLRERGIGLASYLGATRRAVPVGVVVDLGDDVDETVATSQSRVDEGYRRLKVKIAPGCDVDVVRAVRAAIGTTIELWVDANGSYTSEDRALRALDELGLGLIEQPLGPDAWLDHAALARELTTPICLDESICSLSDLRLARHFGAADVINVKPSRVGGLRVARQIVDECARAGIDAWVGGMLDLGINRAVNLAVAALDGCTLPGDISATDRYFERDITEPFVLDGTGAISVPTGPGLGIDVDIEAVAAYTVAQLTLR
ncbi:MAG: o-succinylbenzoate synthase [Actinobacteria bacterium]|nr:MAG: o-succinylbenzoate synthase [Actinomycetota bacterium]